MKTFLLVAILLISMQKLSANSTEMIDNSCITNITVQTSPIACEPSEEDMQLSETLDNVQEELMLIEKKLARHDQCFVFVIALFVSMICTIAWRL